MPLTTQLANAQYQPGAPGATPTSTPTAEPQAAVTVSIKPGSTGLGANAYEPNPLVIPAGTTVRWVNNDSVPHTATSTDGRFDSGVLQPGQEFTFTFQDPGSYPYYCTVHGQQSMNGTVQVTAAQSPTPGPTESPSPTTTQSPGQAPSPAPTSTDDAEPPTDGTE